MERLTTLLGMPSNIIHGILSISCFCRASTTVISVPLGNDSPQEPLDRLTRSTDSYPEVLVSNPWLDFSWLDIIPMNCRPKLP
ncbi:hypothetical protein ACOSP7_006994 [Xanthoceras sorbifolium]